MTKIACVPRNQLGFGWMTPALACVEMMQCFAQAIPIHARRGGGKGADVVAPLLALPHFDSDVVKKLRKQRVTSLKELQALPEGDLLTALRAAGVRGDAAEEVAAALTALPRVAAAVEFEVDGEEEICERDPVHCKVRVLLARPSHGQEGFELKGTAVRAYTPSNPEPQDEAWFAFLTDPANNHVVAWTKANLIEAERDSLEHPEAFAALAAQGAATDVAGGAKAAAEDSSSGVKAITAAANGSSSSKRKKEEEPPGQVLDMVFMAPPAGRYDLVLHLMSSTWVGADLAMPAKLRVATLTRAVAEGRDPKANERKRFDSDSDDDGEDRGSAASGSEEEGSDEEGSGDDYDSEETGELESSDGGEDGDADEEADEDGGDGGKAGAAAGKKDK